MASLATFFERLIIKLYFMDRHSHHNGYVCWCVYGYVYFTEVCVPLKGVCIAVNLQHTAVVHEGFRSNQHFLTVVSLSLKRGDGESEKEFEGIEHHAPPL